MEVGYRDPYLQLLGWLLQGVHLDSVTGAFQPCLEHPFRRVASSGSRSFGEGQRMGLVVGVEAMRYLAVVVVAVVAVVEVS